MTDTEHADRVMGTIGHFDDVYVVDVADLADMRNWHVPARVVIDARSEEPAAAALAQIVVLRRRLRASGGDLAVAASPTTASALRCTGLHWVISCCDDVSAAISAMGPPRRSR
jgi:hypothetical protein